jgi:hypothetical protein
MIDIRVDIIAKADNARYAIFEAPSIVLIADAISRFVSCIHAKQYVFLVLFKYSNHYLHICMSTYTIVQIRNTCKTNP